MDDGDNLGIDEQAQYDSEWMQWAGPQRLSGQVEALFTTTLAPAWGGAVVSADDRFADEILYRIEDVFEQFFPDYRSLTAPGNREIADRFCAYIGEVFAHRAGGLWVNVPGGGEPVYERIGPSVSFGYTDDVVNVVQSLLTAVEYGIGDVITEIYDHTVDYADHTGSRHEFHGIRGEHISDT